MSSRPSLRQRKKEAARERILRAAHELFIERGYENTTVYEIADRADVSESTFFRYFGNKEGVAFGDTPDRIAALLEALDPEAPDPIREVRQSITAQILEFTGGQDGPAPYIQRWFTDPALQRQLLEMFFVAQSSIVAYLTTVSNPRSRLTTVDAQFVAAAMVAVGLSVLRMAPPTKAATAKALNRGFDVLERGTQTF